MGKENRKQDIRVCVLPEKERDIEKLIFIAKDQRKIKRAR